MAKKYLVKIYEPGKNGAFIMPFENVDFGGFSKEINAGLKEIVFSIPRQFDNFDEGYVIKANNFVEMLVSDKDTSSRLIYSGFMTQYRAFRNGHKDQVSVRCYGYMGKMATSILRHNLYNIQLKTADFQVDHPVMTSNTAPAGYVASAKNIWDSGYQAFEAFNGTVTDVNDAWHGQSGATLPTWLQLQIPTAKKYRGFFITARVGGQAPTAWIVQGSNDGVNYTDLQSYTSTGWTSAETRYFDMLDNKKTWTYYRLWITGSTSGSGEFGIGEVGFSTGGRGLAVVPRASSQSIKNVLNSIVNRYQSEAKRPVVDVDTGSVADTGTAITYTYNAKYFLDAINDTIAQAPAGWYHYTGPDNVFKFKQRNSTADHTFVVGRHLRSVDIDKSMSEVVNNVIFSNGENSQADILKLYTDATSEDAYDDRWEILTDERVEYEDTADKMGGRYLASNKDMVGTISLTVYDNNGTAPDGMDGYDIDNIDPGNTCEIVGFNQVTQKSLSGVFLIVSVHDYQTHADIELERISMSVERQTAENEQGIESSYDNSRPATLNTVQVTGRWRVIGNSGEPAFQNSWSSYGGGTWGNPSFMKDANGFVHLRGLIQHNTSIPLSIMFTLPAGFRPPTVAGGFIFNAKQGNSTARINIYSNGDVQYDAGQSPNAGTEDWVSLNGLYFFAEN
jgi:hypothetical protein